MMNLYDHNKLVLEQVERMRNMGAGVLCPECLKNDLEKELYYSNQLLKTNEKGQMEYPNRRDVRCKECGFKDIILLL